MTTIQRSTRQSSTEIVSPYDDAAPAQPVDGVGALSAFNNAGIDIQIATAHKYPRSVARFLQEAEDLVTSNKSVAKSCTYALPRGGKSIIGPSVRLAEMLASCWGNTRVAAMVTGDDGKFLTATAIGLDLQKNNGIQIEARRRITDKSGRRYDDDMIGVTSNATISVARRNVIFAIIPRTYVDMIHALAMQTAEGSLEELDAARTKWIETWKKKGISEVRVYDALGVGGIQDVTNNHLMIMHGFQTSIKENIATLDEIFPIPATLSQSKAAPSKTATLAGKLAETAKPMRETGQEG